MPKFKITNPNGLINSMNECKKGKLAELNSTDFEIEPETIKSIPGHEPPVNNKTGEQFPC